MENKIRAIIIDDELAARNVIRSLLEWSNVPNLIIAECENLTNGVKKIKELKPNLVFLDIQMPDFAGFEIVNFFEEIDFEIIFITAYDQYAIKAFEISALDYLVKPIDRIRLESALEKAQKKVIQENKLSQFHLLQEVINKQTSQKIIISELVDGHVSQKVIHTNEIIAIEAMRAYSKIYVKGHSAMVVSRNLKSFESILIETKNIIRIHRSWIINVHHVMNYSNHQGIITLHSGVIAKLAKNKIPLLMNVINQSS